MRTFRSVMICALVTVAALGARAAEPEPLTTFENRGPDLPPAGRSLFDHLVAVPDDRGWALSVPWPFEALIERLKAELRPGFREPVKRVLHPISRSLQRHSAAPHFFRFPRAVAAVDTDPAPAQGRSGMMLKDRLYLGYQPRSDSIEVISYNEAAARFEFQVVRDYRAGGEPQVTYADRSLCLACHHNQALIYSEQPWADSNNNNMIAALLLEEAESFYGISARIPFDIAEQFDESTDRANYLAAQQKAWREGCAAAGSRADAVACRRDGLVAALRYRLTAGYLRGEAGDGAYARFAAAVTRGWSRRWPAGIAIASADIADYDPLSAFGYGPGRAALEAGIPVSPVIPALAVLQFDEAYEPLFQRPPAALWRVAPPLAGMAPVTPRWVPSIVVGLGDFLAASDIERLDSHLARQRVGERRVTVACHVDDRGGAITFGCADHGLGGVRIDGRARLYANGDAEGLISRLRADSAAPGGVMLAEAEWREDRGVRHLVFGLRDRVTGLTARTAAGDAIRQVALSWHGADGAAALTVADDFAFVTAAVDRLAAATLSGLSDALDAAPFRRVALLRPLFADLGLPPVDWCCLDSDHLPTPMTAGDE